jgi:hypothetical protein
MKIVDLSPDQQEAKRKYFREAKQRSRQRQRQAMTIPMADVWVEQFPKLHPAIQIESDQYANEFAKSVLSELQIKSSYAIDACLDQVARTSLGLKRNWVRDVQMPAGELVSGTYFPDALGSSLVQNTHRYKLERSQTFSAAYRELLEILDKKYGNEQTKDAHAIKAELDGSYVLPAQIEPEPAPEPDIEARPVKTTAEILADGRANMMRELEPYVGHDALNYLNGL